MIDESSNSNNDDNTNNDANNSSSNNNNIPAERFAEFAESVELGLADYFLGPYGSYASVAAAKAGITATAPARSATSPKVSSKKKKAKEEQTTTKLARQGILNLFSLLKARYTSPEEKQQLAILFSLISNPELQPVREIRGLLGEIDNGTIASIELLDISSGDDDEEEEAMDYFRLSSRQGGGFAKDDAQVIKVEPPAPLGDDYKPAKIRALMKPTSRILRINVLDGGEGYTTAPEVIVKQRGVARQCDACAIIDRKGSVSEIVVLNPGFGYGGQGSEPTIPTVEIKARKSRKNPDVIVRPAVAMVELEYKVIGVEILVSHDITCVCFFIFYA